MLGRMLKQLFLDAIDQAELDASYATEREVWEKLDEAACIFCREIKDLHAEAQITTVAGQQRYDLPGGFIGLYLVKSNGKFFLKYHDGDNYSFPLLSTEDKIYRDNLRTAQTWPNRFAIVDKNSLGSLITGTATAAGTLANGQCVLTDSTKLFTTTNRVWPRDIVYDTTQGSIGYVLSVTDATHLVVALFDSAGAADGITLNDGYTIQPASKQQILLDAPSEASGHTMYVPYICLPEPVFSDLGFWRFSPETAKAMVDGAASLMKMPKREYQEAMQIGGKFAQELSRKRIEIARHALGR